MKRLLLSLLVTTAAFAAGSSQQSMIEIVSATDTTVTYRELVPTRIALDLDAGLYHAKSCPVVRPNMQLTSPAAATLRGAKPHSCVATMQAEYATKTEKRAPRDPNRIAVLYLGNSLVYFNEAPAMTNAIGAREKRPLRVDSVTRSGVTLEQLWHTTASLQRLWQEHWDYVVVQGGGGGVGPLNRTDEFLTYLEKFVGEIRRSGAEPLLYMTWYPNREAEQNAATLAIAKRYQLRVAPVGIAWLDLVSAHRFDRLDRDGVHPDARGAYLIACTVYSTIYGKPAHGAPYELVHLASKSEAYDDALREQTITDVQARLIQDAAWRALQTVR